MFSISSKRNRALCDGRGGKTFKCPENTVHSLSSPLLRLGRNTFAQKMRWFWSGTPLPPKSRLKCNWPKEEETKAVVWCTPNVLRRLRISHITRYLNPKAEIFGNGDIVDERLGKSLLYENLYLKSLRGTLLFMVDFRALQL